MRLLVALSMLIFLLAVPPVLGQTESPAPASVPQAPVNNQQMTPPGGDSGERPFSVGKILTRFEFWLSLIIVGFGTIVVLVQFALLRGRSFDGNDILRVFGVTLIVVGTLYLISAGFGDKQIASAMGLFGTLAGYLLGKASPVKKSAEEAK